jgi:hypothetical protein
MTLMLEYLADRPSNWPFEQPYPHFLFATLPKRGMWVLFELLDRPKAAEIVCYPSWAEILCKNGKLGIQLPHAPNKDDIGLKFIDGLSEMLCILATTPRQE